MDAGRLFKPAGAALLRAAAVSPGGGVPRWPDLADADDCRVWLGEVWPAAGEAVGLASGALAARVGQILGGAPVTDRQVRGAATTVIRYLLRSGGRATPFALFAGVAPARFGPGVSLRAGDRHRSKVRADAAWLGEIIDRLESGPILCRVEVVFNDLAVERGGRLTLPRADGWVEIPLTPPVSAARDAAREPRGFAALVELVASRFPGVDAGRVEALLRHLVAQGFLLSGLRAPMTNPDPLGHLVTALRRAGAADPGEAEPLLADLEQIQTGIGELNALPTVQAQSEPRAVLVAAMDRIGPQRRSPLAVDLLLDCDLRLPTSVASDLATAAGILTRLGREPLGPARWADYHRRFVERYGVSAAVPVTDVVDPAAGLGYPAGYPGSALPVPPEAVSKRDQRLLALAWRALEVGGPLDLTDALIDEITDGDLFDARLLQAHGEIAGRLYARSLEAVDAGDYVLTVTPARAAGTLSARFLAATGDRAMEQIYREAPAIHKGAAAVQLSCPPRFTRGQNVARLPQFLPEVLTVGEATTGGRRLAPADLALTATGRGLLLLEAATGRIVDPQVYHALALDRQLPPLARFLANVPRAYAAALTSFTFGPPAVALPHLPEVRYGRIILAPERWRLDTADLLVPGASAADWHDGLDRWRRRERCPQVVELADGDMTLRLDLAVPAHAAILRDHLGENGSVLLNRAVTEDGLAWIGRAHEIVVPVVRAGPPTPNKLGPLLVRRVNADGDRPGAPDSRWISARVHTHPAAMDDLIATHLPDLRAQLGGATLWMVRYRNPELTDHLRIRIAAGGPEQPARLAAFGRWVAALAATGAVGAIAFDTYFPETGRYGSEATLDAAEAMFCADTAAAIGALRHPPTGMHPDTLTALSMLDLAEAFLGGLPRAADHLAASAVPRQAVNHDIVRATTRLARHGVPRSLPFLPGDLAQAWEARAETLITYRAALPAQMDAATVLASLLHLSFNRHRGIDREREAACLRLTRSAALAWRAAQPPGSDAAHRRCSSPTLTHGTRPALPATRTPA